MGDDDVTNCCHGDLVFEITSNGKGKRSELHREQRRKWERRGGGGDEEGERKGALMFHVGEEKGEKWPYNVRSIQCPSGQFSDVNTFRFIYSRTGLHPLRVSLLILQLLMFRMDFNPTLVTITKVIAWICLFVSLRSSLHTVCVTNCSDERAKRSLIMFIKCL